MKKARYNTFMKTHKKLILVAATVLVVGGAGTGVALAMQDEPKQAVVEQSAAVVPQEQPVETVESAPASETVEQTSVAPQETIQEETERRTREYAAKFGLNADVQWSCINKAINNSSLGGYNDEQAVREFLDKRFAERKNDQGGYNVSEYTGYGCSIQYRTIYL